MSSSKRRQMMQPWPLCLPPFAKTKVRPAATASSSEYVLLRFLSAAAASGFPDIRSRLLVSAPPPSFSRRGAALSRTLVSLSLCPPRSSSPPSRQPHPWATGNFHCTDGRRLPPLQPVFSRLSGRKLSFPGLSLLFLCIYLYLSLALSVCPSLSFSPTFLVPLQPL